LPSRSQSASVPFADLARENEPIRAELDAALAAVIERGWFVLGEEGSQFEAEFADWLGVGHAVGVASGTDAIELALRALELEDGAEVITQANTCVPTVAGIERAGAVPVLCDVEPEAGTMDPESLRDSIGDRTAAVIPVHLYGQCADMSAIGTIANERGLTVIEDCAQAHGAELSGRRAGTMGALGCFSFYPTKNLGALGDAGAVVTDDPALAERLRLLRHYGQVDRYRHEIRGVNSRMDELQAAALRLKLRHLDERNTRRAQIAARYRAALADSPVTPLAELPDRVHAYHLFVATAPDRDRFQELMSQRGVATLVHYPYPVHLHPPYRDLRRAETLCVSERLAKHVVSLPIFPELTDAEVESVSEAAEQTSAELA
jgi:dTDP-4-amino-4,6-dideoxygalactose transaminase